MGRSNLKDFLEAAGYDRVSLSFRQVEVLLGGELPPSLRTDTGWTKPQPDAATVHEDIAGAGFETAEVDLFDDRVVLQRTGPLDPEGLEPATTWRRYDESGRPRRRHPAFGALKGFITVAPGVDLTEPLIDPNWLEEKYGA